MVLDPQRWMELRRFRGLFASGAMSLSEIAKETGLNRRTVRTYLSSEGPVAPPRRAAPGHGPRRKVDEFAPLIDAMLRSEILIKGAVVHERLVAEYGFPGTYQRVKLYMQEARPRTAEELGISPGELAGLHRRFEVVAWSAGPGRLGRRRTDPRPRRHPEGLLVPHDLVLLARSILLLHHRPGPGHLLGLPPPGIRSLRRGADVDRLRPDQDGRPTPRRTGRGRSAAPGSGRIRRTTTSTSMCWPPTAPPGKARVERLVTTGASARACGCPSCRATRRSTSTTSPSSPNSTLARSKIWPPLPSSRPRPTRPCWDRPGSARPTSQSLSRSPPAGPASRSTSRPSTTWSASSRSPRQPDVSTASSAPTSAPASSWSTKSAISHSNVLRRTWCSR